MSKRIGIALTRKGSDGRQSEYGVYENEYGGYSLKYEGHRKGDVRTGISLRDSPEPLVFSNSAHRDSLHRRDFARVHFFNVTDARRYRLALREMRHASRKTKSRRSR